MPGEVTVVHNEPEVVGIACVRDLPNDLKKVTAQLLVFELGQLRDMHPRNN